MRLTTQDTVLGEYNDPLSLHLYTYVEGNPLTRVDPTGHAFACTQTCDTAEGGNLEPTPPQTEQGKLQAIGMTEDGADHYLTTPGHNVDDLIHMEAESRALVVEGFNKEAHYVVSGQMDKDEHLLKSFMSQAASMAPGVGDAKDLQEAATGKDIITGEKLTPFQRGVTGLAVLVPIVGGKFLRNATETTVDATEDVIHLYHGTSISDANKILEDGIDLSKSRAKTDFGLGFYMTTDAKQASEWAAKGWGDQGAVLDFAIPRSELEKLSGLKFGSPDQAWAGFVTHNRSGGSMHTFDFVEGPMLKNPKAFLSGKEPAKAYGQQLSIHSQNAVDLFNRYLPQ